MAGQTSKANQRQSQRRRNNGKMKYTATRSHTIELQCGHCGHKKTVPSQDAYKKGGNMCWKCSDGGVKSADGESYIVNPTIHKYSMNSTPVVRTPSVKK
jgi:ribosomal protein S27E